MSGRLRALGGAVAALALLVPGLSAAVSTPAGASPGGTSVREAAGDAPTGETAARTVVVIDPTAYGELISHDVEVTGVGGATASSFEGTVKVKLPVDAVTETGVKHRGGIRFTAGEAELNLKKVIIPESGFVTAKVTGSAVGKVGRAAVFLQAESDSPLGDTSLRITFTGASYVNQTFGTTFSELDRFAFSTTHL